MVAYVVAFTILVVAGMFLRTVILNFFVGPLIVVGSDALARRRDPGSASAIYLITRSKPWGIGILIGYWSHVLTDTADSVGTMMFFPFTTQHYSIGMWQYSSQQGRYGDAAAYYSSLGWAWDVVWLVLMLLLARKALTAEYFHTNVEPADPFWGTLQHRFRMPDHVRRAVFRAYVVYGAARLVGWFLWARLLNPKRGTETMDLSWTGGADDYVDGQHDAMSFSSVGRAVPIHRMSSGSVAVRRSPTSRQAGSAHDRSDDHDTRFASSSRSGSRGAVPHDTATSSTALLAGCTGAGDRR